MAQGYLIYGLRLASTSELRYIGKTTKGFDRFEDHKNKARWGHPSAKYDWIRHHGPDAVEFVVLEDCPDGDEAYLNQAEIQWIADMLSSGSDLLNHTSGGDGGATRKGMRTPETTKAKQQQARLGRRHSDETRKTLSEGKKSQIYRVCCILCQREFCTGINLDNHLRQSHDESFIRQRHSRKIEKNLASNDLRLQKFTARYPESSTGSCVACRLSFGYPGLKVHMESTHRVRLPSSDKKKWRKAIVDNRPSL